MNRNSLLQTLVRCASLALFSGSLAAVAAQSAYIQAIRITGATEAADPIALAVRGRQALQSAKAVPTDYAASLKLATDSIKLQSLNPVGLSLKATIAYTQRNEALGLTLARLAQEASRRELMANILVIEHEARRGTVSRALDGYDRALRGSSEAGQLLFPILAQAMEDPEIRGGLVLLVKRQTPWLPSFTHYVVERTSNSGYLADVILAAGDIRANDVDGQVTRGLVSALINRGDYLRARSVFLMANPNERAVLQSAALSPQNFSKASGRLGWQLIETPEFGATGMDRGAISVYARATRRGVVAEKILYLEPGSYRFATQERAASVEGRREWSSRCVSTNMERQLLGSNALTDSSTTLNVGRNCPVQLLRLEVFGSDSQEDVQAEIGNISLSRER